MLETEKRYFSCGSALQDATKDKRKKEILKKYSRCRSTSTAVLLTPVLCKTDTPAAPWLPALQWAGGTGRLAQHRVPTSRWGRTASPAPCPRQPVALLQPPPLLSPRARESHNL